MCEQMLAAQRRSTYADFGSGGLFKDVMGPYFHVWQARRGGGTSVPACCSTASPQNPQLLSTSAGALRPKSNTTASDTFIF